MKKTLLTLAASSLVFTLGAGSALADSHEGDGLEPASPLELYACKYNEGMGPADLPKAAAAFNAWADEHKLTDYAAWTLVPFYFSPEQEFDVLWLGGSQKAAALGRAQDLWLSTGGEAAAGFNDLWTCEAHANFATLKIKSPPERENPKNVVVSFSDCNMADDMAFDDLVPSLQEWADYRDSHGSTSGMWILFPAYGGGNEDFDFKFVAAWQNLEDQGTDYDHYNEKGWQKANELFRDKVSCDSSRVYLATNQRSPDSGDD